MSDIIVLLEEQDEPKVNDVIEIFEDATTIFYGLCGIPKTPRYSTGHELKLYKLELQSANAILNRANINNAWQDITIEDLVDEICDDYILREGITKGTISTIGITLDHYVSPDMTVRNVLDELANISGAIWQITTEKVFEFL